MYNTLKRNRTLPLSAGVVVIILLVATTPQISSMMALNGNLIAAPNSVYAKYSNSQAQSLVNECQTDDLGGASNCTNSGFLNQADGAPIISITGGQGTPGPKGDTGDT